MGLFKDFLDSLKDERKEELLLPDALTFPAIDSKKLEGKFNLEEIAKRHGEENYPSSESNDLGAFEAEITEEITKTIRPLQISYTEAMTAYSARISSLDPLGFDAGLRAKSALLKAQIGMTVNQVKGEIFLHANNLKQREKEFLEFKELHGNPADPHLKIKAPTKKAILIALIVFEAVINGLYIGPYLSAGWLEGVGIAIAFPIITLVIFGFMAGISLRKLHAKKLITKAYSLFFICLSFLGATAINLYLAAIRKTVETSDDGITGAIAIWLEYLNLNFNNINEQGLLLLFLASGFFIVAIYDIYSLDHYIPGYLNAYELRQGAHDNYTKKLTDLNNQLIKESNAIKEVAGAYQKLQSWQMEFNNIINNQNQLTRKYKSYIISIEETSNRILKKYREINSHYRSTKSPIYFDTSWKINEYHAWVLDDTSITRDFQNKLKIVYENIESIQKNISEEIDNTRDILKPIDSILVKA